MPIRRIVVVRNPHFNSENGKMSEIGLRQVEKLVDELKTLDLVSQVDPSFVVTSPVPCARSMADHLATEFSGGRVYEWAELLENPRKVISAEAVETVVTRIRVIIDDPQFGVDTVFVVCHSGMCINLPRLVASSLSSKVSTVPDLLEQGKAMVIPCGKEAYQVPA